MDGLIGLARRYALECSYLTRLPASEILPSGLVLENRYNGPRQVSDFTAERYLQVIKNSTAPRGREN